MRHDHFFASAALLDEAENVAQEERAKRASAATEIIKLAKKKRKLPPAWMRVSQTRLPRRKDQESTPNPISFWRKYDDFMLGPDWTRSACSPSTTYSADHSSSTTTTTPSPDDIDWAFAFFISALEFLGGISNNEMNGKLARVLLLPTIIFQKKRVS
jgi:hypothetical protein